MSKHQWMIHIKSPEIDESGGMIFDISPDALQPKFADRGIIEDFRNLFINPGSDQVMAAMGYWSWMPSFPDLQPIAVTRFGGLVLENLATCGPDRADDPLIVILDPDLGKLTPVALSIDEFAAMLRSPQVREDLLHEAWIQSAESLGLRLEQEFECYDWAVPLQLGGSETPDNLDTSSLAMKHCFAGQIKKQLIGMPDGAEIIVADD